MEYSYDYAYNMEEAMEALGMTGFDLIYNLGSVLVSIVGYVFLAIGLYTIAKRRGINHPWLAWIPMGNIWLLGCISDQYRYVALGQEKSKRKWLLGLDIVTLVFAIATIVLLVMSLIDLFELMKLTDTSGGTYTSWNDEFLDQLFIDALMPMLGACGLALVMCGFAIALAVLEYMALYDLYTSCEPNNKALYLVLSIFFSIAMPILVFICRNKDLGMPPRRDRMFQQPPAQPIVAQPTWQPPQPPAEPWERQDIE